MVNHRHIDESNPTGWRLVWYLVFLILLVPVSMMGLVMVMWYDLVGWPDEPQR